MYREQRKKSGARKKGKLSYNYWLELKKQQEFPPNIYITIPF